MTALAATLALEQIWKDRLGLANRAEPEFYESSDSIGDAPHALAIRTALDDLKVSGVFCVQGVPTVVLLETEVYDRVRVMQLHAALWNQGLASLLLVIAEKTLRAFSLAKKPYKNLDHEFEKRCLVETLHSTSEALKFLNLIQGAESGRLWNEHESFFDPKERVDQVLLQNLIASHDELLEADLDSEAAQALLIQMMFIAYLEDRQILSSDYYREILKNDTENFSSLLSSKNNVALVKALFAKLRADFNGDLFVAPCSFEARAKAPAITAAHLSVLARFRDGREEMGNARQLRFWGYDFRYIPIELVSAVYDSFLGNKEVERREQGAYYTPMFLADTIVSQVWDNLSPEVREKGRFLDPACGSGVFLVRSFQRLCEHWRATRRQKTIRWDSLLAILERVNGWDLNGGAVRVAVFSLYVALLEEVSPPDIRLLIKRGKILPELWGKTLVHRDFFEVDEAQNAFDVIVGNPPWSSRRGDDRPSVRWCETNRCPMPGGEDAWAFTWKALRHLTTQGSLAFLLPAMGFLHNHAANAVEARKRLLQESRVHRIINFADLRFQLFEKAHRPAALFVVGKSPSQTRSYRFDYWTPKADLNLRMKRVITLSRADKLSLSTETAIENPLAFKQRLWMREPDAKLFGYLASFKTLGSFIKDYGGIARRREDPSGQWVIGQGYQPHNEHLRRKRPSRYSMSQFVGTYPDLPIGAFQKIAQSRSGLAPAPSHRVRRKGFEVAFDGPRILIPRGVETSQSRLRATYIEEPLTFEHIIQGVTVPRGQERRAKLLVAVLNSQVAVWFAFHGTASFGSDRPEVQQAELLHLPFPLEKDLPDPERAKVAAEKLVELVDGVLHQAKRSDFSLADENALLREIDKLSCEYFCLSDDEIILVEDTVNKIIPAIQPHEGGYPDLWRAPTASERKAYALTLAHSVAQWLDGSTVAPKLESLSDDLGVLCLSLDETGRPVEYVEARDASLGDLLAQLATHIHRRLDGNFQLQPDFRAIVGRNLYLVKPMQLRFWLKSAALADSDAIAMDLQDAIEREPSRSVAE
jgi:hypothetical protein